VIARTIKVLRREDEMWGNCRLGQQRLTTAIHIAKKRGRRKEGGDMVGKSFGTKPGKGGIPGASRGGAASFGNGRLR